MYSLLTMLMEYQEKALSVWVFFFQMTNLRDQYASSVI